MKKLQIIFILLLFTAIAFSQAKKPPVKGRVTIKGNLPPSPKSTTEEDTGIWNEFKSKEFDFSITFPAKAENVWDDQIKEVTFFHCSTRKANYGLIIKSSDFSVFENQLDEYYEILIAELYDPKTTKILSKKKIQLGDTEGRELFFEQDYSKVFGRLFIVKNKLYVISVILDKKKYDSSFDKWALKFMDSFSFKMKLDNEG